METNFYTDDFELMLREKADEFKLQPHRRVWRSIYNGMHPSRKWPSIAISIFIVMAVSILGYFNSRSEKQLAHAGNTENQTSPDLLSSKSNPDILSASQSLNQHNNSVTTTTNPVSGNNSLSVNTSQISYANNIAVGHKNPQQITPVNLSSNISTKNIVPTVVNDISGLEKNIQAQQIISPTDEKTKPINTVNVDEEMIVKHPVSNNKMPASINNDMSIFTAKTKPYIAVNTGAAKEQTAASGNAQSVRVLTDLEKAWLENFAFYNKNKRNKWKERMLYEFYATPGISYRSLSTNTNYNANLTNLVTDNTLIDHTPSLSAEIGATLIYSFAKNFRIKSGLQFNYTSYGIKAYETNHPVLTTLLVNDINTGYPYLVSRSTSISNTPGNGATTFHNKTYQVSIPIGLEVKLAGNGKIQWYGAGTIQPTYLFGGKSYLLSSDKKNYVGENAMIRKWNINAGMETFISYKTSRGVILQVGPQLRYQLLSTYGKKFSMEEKLYSVGLKMGLIRNF